MFKARGLFLDIFPLWIIVLLKNGILSQMFLGSNTDFNTNHSLREITKYINFKIMTIIVILPPLTVMASLLEMGCKPFGGVHFRVNC